MRFSHCPEQVFVVGSDGRGAHPVSSCWQRGTLFRDVIVGTGAADTIDAYLDADRVYGEEGNDVLNGWGGSDFLYGGAGQDLLRGGRGADRLAARDGQLDMIRCGPGRDRVLADRIDFVARDCELVARGS